MEIDGRVGEVVDAAIRLDDAALDEVFGHLAAVPGKGLRGRLLLASAAALRPRAEPPLALAAGVELLHLATLHHDDVVDGADTRRGRVSVNARWGDHVATFTGTYLLARAIELLATGGPLVDAATARCTAELWAGQTTELVHARRTDRTVAEYWAVVDQKTGSLFGLSCLCGGLAADGSPEAVAALERLGRLVGRAFQLADDIADLERTAASLGKPADADLRAGVYTLPTLLELEDRGPRDPGLRRLLEAHDAAAAVAAADLIRAGSGLRRAHDELVVCARRAREELAAVGTVGADELHALVDEACGAVVAGVG